MNRAPLLPMTAARLRSVDVAKSRNFSMETPAKRASSSTRLALAIRQRTPPGSVTASLHESVQNPASRASPQCLARMTGAIAQVRRLARRVQQRRGIEDDNVFFCSSGLACEQRTQPRRIFGHAPAG